MKKHIGFKINNDLTIATLKTSRGTYFGIARKNSEKDPLNPSVMLGCEIAEKRAYINLYKDLIKDKKIERKGIERLLAAMPEGKPGRKYAVHMLNTINNEIQEYKDLIDYEQRSIKHLIEGRAIYLRSRTMNKEEREKAMAGLGEAISTLGKINKDKTP